MVPVLTIAGVSLPGIAARPAVRPVIAGSLFCELAGW
jgi:hypothetical protein